MSSAAAPCPVALACVGATAVSSQSPPVDGALRFVVGLVLRDRELMAGVSSSADTSLWFVS